MLQIFLFGECHSVSFLTAFPTNSVKRTIGTELVENRSVTLKIKSILYVNFIQTFG